MRNRLLHAILVTLLLATTLGPSASAGERDPIGPVHDMGAPQFEAFPPDAIAQPNADAIIALVNEAREFGVPLAVRVVSFPTEVEALSAFNDIDLSQPIQQESVRDMAEAWMASEPVESSPGAGDGFLMLVVMPDDHTLSSAVIQPGANALPLNGITQANIDQVMTELVLPRFANNEVSQGIRDGLSVFSYNNLFGEPERSEPSPLHEDLGLVASVPLAAITVLSAAGLVALGVWISRRSTQPASPANDTRLSPFAAAALQEGRVNDAVVAAGLLELVRTGILGIGKNSSTGIRLDRSRSGMVTDPFLASIVTVLRANADDHGVVSSAATQRLHDLMTSPRRQLEDQLARDGFFNRDGRVETMWLILGSALVGSIALFTLLPSILGMTRIGILAILLAAACIVGMLVWASRRSWTTEQGRQALEQWRQTSSPGERAVFDTVFGQDALVTATGGPAVPDTVALVRSLRGLGPA